MNYAEGIQSALNFIENNLTDELDSSEISSKAYTSSFNFQKLFAALCGITLGEYIRRRRLTRAGEELCSQKAKVIDVALKYGYDSPDSFTKAFTRFHGITPSAARTEGAKLKSFAPLHIQLTLKGGDYMDYRIEKLGAMTIIGKKYVVSHENAYEVIPKMWQEYIGEKLYEKVKCPLGVCVSDESNPKQFFYIIGDLYNGTDEVPDGFELYEIPEYQWAKFTCKGQLPYALQEVNTKLWSEWVPTNGEFDLASSINIEMYTEGDSTKDDYISEIWVPVKKK